MALSVAPLYAALLGLLLIYLSIRVIRLRRRLKVEPSHGTERRRRGGNRASCILLLLASAFVGRGHYSGE